MAKESLREHLNRKIKEKGSTLSKEKAKAKKYKSIASAKKAGSLYYTNKAGKVMAAVYATDLKGKQTFKKSANKPGLGSDDAITYKGGAAAQRKGANTPKPRSGNGITSRKLSPATVGKGRGDGEMELFQRKVDKRRANLPGAPKPQNGSSPKPKKTGNQNKK